MAIIPVSQSATKAAIGAVLFGVAAVAKSEAAAKTIEGASEADEPEATATLRRVAKRQIGRMDRGFSDLVAKEARGGLAKDAFGKLESRLAACLPLPEDFVLANRDLGSVLDNALSRAAKQADAGSFRFDDTLAALGDGNGALTACLRTLGARGR